MRVLGVSAGFHDAGLAVVEDGDILFAGHSERFSKQKHDEDLCPGIINAAYATGAPMDVIAY